MRTMFFLAEPFSDALSRIGETGVLGALLVLTIFGLVWFTRRLSALIDKTTTRIDSITERFINHLETTKSRETEALLHVASELRALNDEFARHEREALVREQEIIRRIQTP